MNAFTPAFLMIGGMLAYLTGQGLSVIAQVPGSFSIMQWCILLIVVISVVGILYVVVQANGVAIPGWVVKIFWIVAVAVVAIFAIKILMGMM